MLLAAGNSTRIAPVSHGLPKPLMEVGGRPVIEHNILWLKSFGVTDLIVNVHYRPDDIIGRLGDGSKLGVAIEYSREDSILGTAGAVKKLQDEWRSTFLTIYGDSLLNFDLTGLVETHKRLKTVVTVAVFSRVANPNSGVAGSGLKIENNRIVEFTEGGGDEHEYVNTGCYVCEPALLDFIPDHAFYDFGRDLFPDLLRRGAGIGAHEIDGYCLGIDDPAAYDTVQRMLKKQEVALP